MSRFWAQRNPRERFLIVLCLIAVVVGVPLMLMSPDGVGRNLLPAAQARQKRETLLKEKAAMEDEIGRLKPEIEKMVYRKSPEQVLPEVIRALQKHAKASGIHLREIKPLRVRRLGDVTRVPLSVRFATEFKKIVPLFYRLEDPRGKWVVEKFNISADPKSRTVDVDAQIALFTQ